MNSHEDLLLGKSLTERYLLRSNEKKKTRNEHPPEEIIPDELPPEEPVYQPSYSFRGRGRGRGRGWGYDGHFQSDYAGRHMTRPYEGRGRGRGRGLRGGRYQGYNHRGPRSRPPLRSHPYVAEPLRYSAEDGIYQPTGDMHYDPRVFDYKYQYDGYAERYPQGYENKYAHYREGHGSFRGRPPQHYNAYRYEVHDVTVAILLTSPAVGGNNISCLFLRPIN